jgi:biotin carboxylase
VAVDDPRARGARLLVLGAGPAQLGLLRAARAAGLETVVVDRDPAAPGFEHASKRAVVSTEDELGVERLARAEGVDGLISPGADWPVAVAARVAERMGLPHPISAATAALATNKQRQRARLAEAGVPQPASRVLSGWQEGLGGLVPCVVKAPDRQGQRGLALVRSAAELRPAVEAAIEASRNGSCLVEEWIEGPEVTVNAVSAEGRFTPLTVTDRLTAEPPAFGVALAHVWPSEHDVSGAVDAAAGAVAALGIRTGPSYTQVRLGPDGARVVEVAARLGGGHDAELCAAAVGVDLNGLALEAALGGGERRGNSPLQGPPAGGGACVVFLVAPEGRLVATHGVEEARAGDGVLDVLVYRRPGHVFGPLRRGPDRAGAIIAVGGSRDEALARGRRAAASVRFEVA